ncbi:MAG: uroporphyrinogen-III C-methyltransferase [Pseudomonadota bacterium]
MSEELTPPGGTAPVVPNVARDRRAGALAVAALILSAALGGGLYYVSQRAQQALAAVQSQADQRQQSLENALAQTREAQTKEAAELAALRGQYEDLLTQVQELQSRTADERRHWALGEAEYLLRIANHRLQLMHDVGTSLAALKAADQLLQKRTDPALHRVRATIAREIVALETLPHPDIEGLAARLTALSGKIEDLPIKHRPHDFVPPGAETTEAAGADQAFARFWQKLKSLVVIRRDDQPIEPLLAPQEERYLRLNAHLKIEAARLALLAGDAQSWTASVQTLTDWISGQYDADAPTVKAVLGILSELHGANIAVNWPDISSSSQLLHEYRLKLSLIGTEAQAPAKPKPRESAP